MQTAPVAIPPLGADAGHLEALAKRLFSGESTLPCHAHGLSITEHLDFGTIDPEYSSSSHSLPLSLVNSSPNPISIISIHLIPLAEVFGVYSDSSLNSPVTVPVVIPSGCTISLTLCIRACSHPGRFCCRLVATATTLVETNVLEQQWCSFIIGCTCTAVVRNPLVDSAADVEAKAFVPAAIRSIFNHAVPSYSLPPPHFRANLRRVCCLCHHEIPPFSDNKVTTTIAKEQSCCSSSSCSGSRSSSMTSTTNLCQLLISESLQSKEGKMFSKKSFNTAAEQSASSLQVLQFPTSDHHDSQFYHHDCGKPEIFALTRCSCTVHPSCLRRWAIVLSEVLSDALPCPACGLEMEQLSGLVSSILATKKAAHQTRFRSSSSHLHPVISILTERVACYSDSSAPPQIKAAATHRHRFIQHVVNLFEATTAEFFARADEVRDFTAYDVEFREIETESSPSTSTQFSCDSLNTQPADHSSDNCATAAQILSARMQEPATLLLLTLPGVPENSPKVQLYQTLRLRFSRRGLVQSPHTIYGAEFACYILKVRGSHVIVACHPSIQSVLRSHYADPFNLHVFFSMDLTGISRDYRMLLFGLKFEFIEPLLFPSQVQTNYKSTPPAVGVFDERMSSSQLQCVAFALQNATRNDTHFIPAHIVCGPPGTGKTSVVAEITLQLWQPRQSDDKGVIFVTAPSPDAADVLALRLCQHLTAEELLLVCSSTRSVDTLRPGLRDYANIETTDVHGIPLDLFVLPSIASLRSCSIIVASCSACAELSVILAAAGQHDEFQVSIVIVDEAAQATEVDALKALTFVGKHTRVLLAGDHMQLGPVIISQRALDLRFEVSLMQRLVGMDLYRQPGLLSVLNVNYRSHPALIAVPSLLFYKNSIRCSPQPCSDQDRNSLFSHFAGPPHCDFPLFFYGVAGMDSSPDGHGVCNAVEANFLLFLVSKLLEDVPMLSQSDIGVMAPFRLQVRLVRKLFRGANLRDVKVGTVDDYQGQEGKVIFLSTTVSRRYGFSDFSGDLAALSFIGNPQRFNVALSRAQLMLIIVGDPWVLNMDR